MSERNRETSFFIRYQDNRECFKRGDAGTNRKGVKLARYLHFVWHDRTKEN